MTYLSVRGGPVPLKTLQGYLTEWSWGGGGFVMSEVRPPGPSPLFLPACLTSAAVTPSMRETGWVVPREPQRRKKQARLQKAGPSARSRDHHVSYIYTETAVNDIETRAMRLALLEHSNTVGLVVEYSPATGETRVRFSDGVPSSTKRRASQLCKVLFLPF